MPVYGDGNTNGHLPMSESLTQSYSEANAWTDTASAHVPIGPLLIGRSENSTVVLVGNGKA